MTRILADLLQAPEPHFRLNLRQLEQTSGHQNIDIKLSVEVVRAAKQKMRQLGLDQHDTTGEELYQALMQRVSADDKRLERALRTRSATYISAEADLMAGMVHALEKETGAQNCFALKSATAKRLLKKVPPKRLVKQLNYRSLDSMLRHEALAPLIAAAQAIESTAWQRAWQDAYKSLRPADFESRPVKIICPQGGRWQVLTEQMVRQHRHTVLGLQELGAVVLLPLPATKPDGLVIASVALALQELNEIQAASNYLQASQVRADFAARVQAVASGSMVLTSKLQGQALPWRVVQQYFSRQKTTLQEEVFGPYLQAAELYWHDVEKLMSRLVPSLAFWEDTAYLGTTQNTKPVSYNLLDVATDCCNKASYELRSVQHAQQALWNELTLRYLNQANVEQAVAAELQPQFATELAIN